VFVSPDIGIAIRVMTALVFISAALGKMTHWPEFEGVVANYRLLPDSLVRGVAYALPPLEIMIGLGLLSAWATPWIELAAASLLTLFAVAMAVNLWRGRPHIDCGCFQSTLRQTLRWSLVARNLSMVLLLGIALVCVRTRADAWSAINGLLGGAALFVVLQSLNTLWAVPRTGVPRVIVPAGRPRAVPHAHSEG
jgi:uncharacterized membrane protein YphA (DoxX/SURF4 family)